MIEQFHRWERPKDGKDQSTSCGNTATGGDQELIALLAGISQGEEKALGVFFDRTGSFVYGLALRILEDSMTAEEVAMDVYLQVWRQAKKFDHSRGKPIGWLTVLTRSRAIDRFRAEKKDCNRPMPIDEQNPMETRPELLKIGSDPEVKCLQVERRRIVRQSLSLLPPEQREVIELGYFRGLSQNEIARHISQPLGTVKTRVRLGMDRLRTRFGSSNRDYFDD